MQEYKNLAGTVRLQNIFESTGGTGVGAGDPGLVALSFLKGRTDHFVRNRIGKENHKIGAPNLPPKISRHFGKHLRFTAVLFADGLILTFHAFISTDDNNAHF